MPSDDVSSHIIKLEALIAQAETFLTWPGVVVSTKTISQVAQEYGDTLDRIVRDTLARRMDKVDFSRAHKALIRASAREAYLEGVREGGGGESDIEENDEGVIADWVSGQVGYVGDFAKSAWDASGVGAPDGAAEAVLERVLVWVDSLRNLGDMGRLSIEGNIYLTLDGEDGEENCPECQTYKGQRHRKSWWEARDLLRRNGNENYTCGRFDNCHHHFKNDAGEVIVR